ncbi:hypothetical protein C8R45DRAFT_941939 [Mycena sanguinolenta]|nr:hypothetical protein C8R45DRAFT_941939 [Mycena sanguinolenta]
MRCFEYSYPGEFTRRGAAPSADFQARAAEGLDGYGYLNEITRRGAAPSADFQARAAEGLDNGCHGPEYHQRWLYTPSVENRARCRYNETNGLTPAEGKKKEKGKREGRCSARGVAFGGGDEVSWVDGTSARKQGERAEEDAAPWVARDLGRITKDLSRVARPRRDRKRRARPTGLLPGRARPRRDRKKTNVGHTGPLPGRETSTGSKKTNIGHAGPLPGRETLTGSKTTSAARVPSPGSRDLDGIANGERWARLPSPGSRETSTGSRMMSAARAVPSPGSRDLDGIAKSERANAGSFCSADSQALMPCAASRGTGTFDKKRNMQMRVWGDFDDNVGSTRHMGVSRGTQHLQAEIKRAYTALTPAYEEHGRLRQTQFPVQGTSGSAKDECEREQLSRLSARANNDMKNKCSTVYRLTGVAYHGWFRMNTVIGRFPSRTTPTGGYGKKNIEWRTRRDVHDGGVYKVPDTDAKHGRPPHARFRERLRQEETMGEAMRGPALHYAPDTRVLTSRVPFDVDGLNDSDAKRKNRREDEHEREDSLPLTRRRKQSEAMTAHVTGRVNPI